MFRLMPRLLSPRSADEHSCQPCPAPREPRDRSVETLRGLALLLLVGFHATFEDTTSLDQGVLRSALYDYVGESLAFIRMPLFTVISGFVYAARPLQPGGLLRFLRGKARRLLLPGACAITLTLLLSHLSGTSNHLALPWSETHHAYLYGYLHFWFLQAILWVFVAVALLERSGMMNSAPAFLSTLALATLAKVVLPSSGVLSFSGALYLLPYFILGLGLRRFHRVAECRGFVALVFCASCLGLFLQQAALQGYITLDLTKTGPLGTLVGLSSTFCIVLARRTCAPLATLGTYSYTVYLYHHFGLSLGKRLYLAFDTSSYELLVLSEWVIAIASGVALDHGLRRLPEARAWLLGFSRPPRAQPQHTSIRNARCAQSAAPPRLSSPELRPSLAGPA